MYMAMYPLLWCPAPERRRPKRKIYIYIYIYILDSHMAPYGASEVA